MKNTRTDDRSQASSHPFVRIVTEAQAVALQDVTQANQFDDRTNALAKALIHECNQAQMRPFIVRWPNGLGCMVLSYHSAPSPTELVSAYCETAAAVAGEALLAALHEPRQ